MRERRKATATATCHLSEPAAAPRWLDGAKATRGCDVDRRSGGPGAKAAALAKPHSGRCSRRLLLRPEACSGCWLDAPARREALGTAAKALGATAKARLGLTLGRLGEAGRRSSALPLGEGVGLRPDRSLGRLQRPHTHDKGLLVQRLGKAGRVGLCGDLNIVDLQKTRSDKM